MRVLPAFASPENLPPDHLKFKNLQRGWRRNLLGVEMHHEGFVYPYNTSAGGYAAPSAAAAASMQYSSSTTHAAAAPTAAAAAGMAYRGQVEPLQRVIPQHSTYTRPGAGLPVAPMADLCGGSAGGGGAAAAAAGSYQQQQQPVVAGMGFTLRDFFRVVRDKEKLSLWLSTHRGSLQAWTGFIVVVLIVYHLFSDGDFSFLMTLSSLISMFSFLMVVYKIEANNSAAGVSLKMMECYVVLIFARLCSIIPFEGYLPYDRSGDWLYQTVEALSLLLAGTIVYMCRSRYGSSYEASVDTLNHLFLMIPAAFLAILFHPSLNAFMPADIAWTFALYLEAVAVLPQLFMFQKEGKVESFTTHFLAGQVLSQAFSFIFWVSSYSELNGPQNSLKSYVGQWVIGMQVVQLVVMADFIYHYVRCISKGVPVQYMLSENV